MIRWLAVITYRTDTGPVEVTHDLEELYEVQTLVERGPDWDTIVGISITRASLSALTVEKAATQ